ncbi:DUF2141 domain-containing protein [Chitinivibrio alkaliphilus]|uniref:DUF2141 domain-containing protein n=1 Tax=Chitinivibrio alkaliphilus ACht1 TaxID=1313304 RepID=U7D6K9_9BACT|nr:DUF2141 domain-containing protein [Chitinivibrio alkaliphilus]ERP31206.1 hypothetical protein CALK_1919 [Chitinivibrio alkaliphilus ACht1]
MKLCLWLVCLVAFLSAASLGVTITGHLPEKGDLYIALYRDEYGFGDFSRAYKKTVISAESVVTDTLRGSFHNLTVGDVYALFVFQDISESGVLDRNFKSQPVEPYGFSGTKKEHRLMSFIEACFIFRPSMEIDLHLHYEE